MTLTIDPTSPDTIDLATMFPPGCRFLRVRGDGFAAEHLRDGDAVVIAPDASAVTGKMVVASVNGVIEIGRYHFGILKEHDARLVKVIGIVVGVVRKVGST